jgi:hypothetical protein
VRNPSCGNSGLINNSRYIGDAELPSRDRSLARIGVCGASRGHSERQIHTYSAIPADVCRSISVGILLNKLRTKMTWTFNYCGQAGRCGVKLDTESSSRFQPFKKLRKMTVRVGGSNSKGIALFLILRLNSTGLKYNHIAGFRVLLYELFQLYTRVLKCQVEYFF